MSVSDLRTAVRIAALTLLSTCTRTPDLPDAPDVSRLLSAYQAPGGSVDTSRSAPWLDRATAQLDLIGGGQATVVITQIAASVAVQAEQGSVPGWREGIVPTRVDGIAKLAVRCGVARDETADVVISIVDGKISPLLWGTAQACPLWQTLGATAAYDGRFTMYRYPDNKDLLVRVDGSIAGDGPPVNMDFRLIAGRLETRVTTPSGDVIVRRGGTDVIVRAANGSFRCDPARRSCRRATS